MRHRWRFGIKVGLICCSFVERFHICILYHRDSISSISIPIYIRTTAMAPSISTLLTLGTFLTTTLAAPADHHSQRNRHNGAKWHRYSEPQMQSLKAAMPTLEGLAPNANVTLFAPVLGIGTQNYTCNGTDFVQTEPQSGAVAALHDISGLLMRDNSNVDSIAQDFKDGRLRGLGPQIGLHYFSEENVPIFNLTEAPEEAVLAGAKIAEVDAPDSKLDLPWLFLLDANDGISKKLNTVYRVDTDEGVNDQESCQQVGKVVEKPYAAQYW